MSSRDIFSSRFIVARGLSGQSTIVTVPAGRIHSIKQLTFYANPLLEPTRGFFMDLDSGAALFSGGTQAGTPAWFGFFGTLVFNAGQSYAWQVSAGPGDGADVGAFGFDFAAPSP